MNMTLYQNLLNAYNFLVRDEENCQKIQRLEREIRSIQFDIPVLPYYKEKKINGWVVFFWLWVFSPVALIYVISVYRKNQENKEKYEKMREEILNSPTEIERREQQNKEIAELKIQLEQAKNARIEFYNNNYSKAMSFLPNYYRDKRSVSVLLHYVKTGWAETLSQAQTLYAKELQELDEMRERREEREQREQWHKEEQERLGRIADNQKRILEEIEYAEKYGVRIRRG